ncbi:hypothetical protein PFISCL1PPCAC_6534, partial [Pristionchus fissidentatus]
LQGDSGGPLLMKSDEGRWFQVGITSFGNNGNLLTQQDISPAEFTGVYTNVKEYCDWIKETTDGEASCEDEIVTLEDFDIDV